MRKKKIKLECIDCMQECVVTYQGIATIECCPFCSAEINFVDEEHDDEIIEDD